MSSSSALPGLRSPEGRRRLYTTGLLDDPPDGVRYTTYAQAIEAGDLREKARRGSDPAGGSAFLSASTVRRRPRQSPAPQGSPLPRALPILRSATWRIQPHPLPRLQRSSRRSRYPDSRIERCADRMALSRRAEMAEQPSRLGTEQRIARSRRLPASSTPPTNCRERRGSCASPSGFAPGTQRTASSTGRGSTSFPVRSLCRPRPHGSRPLVQPEWRLSVTTRSRVATSRWLHSRSSGALDRTRAWSSSGQEPDTRWSRRLLSTGSGACRAPSFSGSCCRPSTCLLTRHGLMVCHSPFSRRWPVEFLSLRATTRRFPRSSARVMPASYRR